MRGSASPDIGEASSPLRMDSDSKPRGSSDIGQTLCLIHYKMPYRYGISPGSLKERQMSQALRAALTWRLVQALKIRSHC